MASLLFQICVPLFGVQVNMAQIWLVNKNGDSIVAFELKVIRGFLDETSSIGIPGGRKVEIEVRILPQRNPPFVGITKKIPENFLSL